MSNFNLDVRGLPPVECCIRYGSSFFSQHKGHPFKQDATRQLPAELSSGVHLKSSTLPQSSSCTPIKDFLFLVPSAKLPQWHKSNLLSNPDHYSPAIRFIAKWCGVDSATRTVLRFTHMSGIPIFFNCLVPLKGNSGEVCIFGVFGDTYARKWVASECPMEDTFTRKRMPHLEPLGCGT